MDVAVAGRVGGGVDGGIDWGHDARVACGVEVKKAKESVGWVRAKRQDECSCDEGDHWITVTHKLQMAEKNDQWQQVSLYTASDCLSRRLLLRSRCC